MHTFPTFNVTHNPSPIPCVPPSTLSPSQVKETKATFDTWCARLETAARSTGGEGPQTSTTTRDTIDYDSLHGATLNVFFSKPQWWCRGVVVAFDPVTDTHTIVYDDGHEGQHRLVDTNFQVLQLASTKPAPFTPVAAFASNGSTVDGGESKLETVALETKTRDVTAAAPAAEIQRRGACEPHAVLG